MYPSHDEITVFSLCLVSVTSNKCHYVLFITSLFRYIEKGEGACIRNQVFRMTCVSMCGLIYLTIFSKACSCGVEDPNDCSQKAYCNALVDGKGCEGETEGRKGSEGLSGNTVKRDRKQGWKSKRERGRVGEKLKETDVENHLGMGECGW